MFVYELTANHDHRQGSFRFLALLLPVAELRARQAAGKFCQVHAYIHTYSYMIVRYVRDRESERESGVLNKEGNRREEGRLRGGV